MQTLLILLSLVATDSVEWSFTPEPMAWVFDADSCNCGPSCDCGKGKSCDCVPAYTEAIKAVAVRENTPLVVYVGQPAERVSGAFVCTSNEYDGDKTPRVIRLFPRAGKLWERLAETPRLMPLMNMGACRGGS